MQYFNALLLKVTFPNTADHYIATDGPFSTLTEIEEGSF